MAADGGLVAHGGPHVFVDDLELLQLADDDAHHLRKALRMRPGDALTASDGAGAWRSVRFGSGDLLEAAAEIVHVPLPAPSLHIAFALVKGSRPELVVQKLTELGVDRIQPFTAERSVVQWNQDKADKNQVRLARVAKEAAMQSHRAWLPTVEPLTTFAQCAAWPGVVRADMEGPAPSLASTTVLIGPEGGWSPGEREAIPTAMGVGPHVLRAETAAIAVGVLLAALRHGSVSPAP